MSKQGFDGKQIRAILIEVGTESVPEGMAGDPVFPSQPFFMQSDMMWDMLMVEGPGFIPLLCEQPVPWASPCREGIPVFQDGIPGWYPMRYPKGWHIWRNGFWPAV